MSSGKHQADIVAPHEHDVLSGRGNFVNYHAGNEHFRALVRKHKLEYVRCPKPQKGKFSKMIVDEIKNRNPPGRFLKQDSSTKMWYDIGEKKALDKTRQALREGAPDIMKEITGESGDEGSDDDVRKDPLPHHFLSSNLQSPGVLGRNQFSLASPAMTSPGLLSPASMLMSSNLSPDMQLSGGRKLPQGLSSIPAPQVHQQLDASNMNHLNQQMMMSMLGNQMGGQMMSPQMNQQLNQQMNQQLSQQINQLNQQINQRQNNINMQQNSNNAAVPLAEMQMLQNRLQSIYSNDQFEPRPMGGVGGQQQEQPIDRRRSSGAQMPPPAVHSSSEIPQHKTFGGQQQPPKIDTFPGNNPRRMPPPSLVKQDSQNSIKVDKLFSAGSPSSQRRKYDAGGSSNHLSAMSLSMGDLGEDNLSSVFDSSLRISVQTDKDPSSSKSKGVKDRSSGNWDGTNPLDSMSVATFGDRYEERGNLNMSFATIGDNKMNESEGNMSFSKVFEDRANRDAS